jgi:carbon monoxide dehydrogenase subunit G
VGEDVAVAELVCSVEIDASADAVWTAVTDWRRQHEWMLGTRVAPTSRDGRGVGATVEAVTGIGPLVVRDPMEIAAWEPPRRCIVRHTGRVVRGAGAFEVEPIGADRARFTWAEWLELPLGSAGQVGFLAARPLLRAGLKLSLRRLARRLAPRTAPSG